MLLVAFSLLTSTKGRLSWEDWRSFTAAWSLARSADDDDILLVRLLLRET